MFEEIASRSFKETDRGETIFYFPRFPFISGRGHVVPTREETERLRMSLSKFHMISILMTVPFAVIFALHILKSENLAIAILAVFVTGLSFRLVYVQFFLLRLVRGYQRTAERIGFLEAQRMQADGYSMKSFRNFGWLVAFLIGLGIVALLWGKITIGIITLAVFGLFGLQFMYLARIRRLSPGSRLQERSPDRTNDG